MDHVRMRIGAAFLSLAVLILSGCQFDLNVPNPNAPNRERVLVTPQDVENMIGGTYLNYWQGTHFYYPSHALSTMADELTCGWGNYGCLDLSSEPRKAWNNSIRHDKNRQLMTWSPWSLLYSAISMVTDGLKSIDDGLRIVDAQGLNNTTRAIAFAKFIMGISHAFLGCYFDQGFILDETVDLEKDLNLKPYSDLVEKGIEYLESCAAICDTAEFELPDDWINGCPLNQDELKALAHSYIARFLVFEARSREERDAADWEKIKNHAEQAITQDFFIQGDGEYWWSGLHYTGQMEGFVRADYKCIGPGDISGNYQAWLETPVAQRNYIIIHSPDIRLCSGFSATNNPAELENIGTDFSFKTPAPFKPSRGTYHFSYYFHDRYIEHVNTGGASPMPEFLAADIDLILAEYHLRKGDGNQAAYYINKTRTTRGGLPPVSAADGIGDVSDERSIYGSLWATFMYEKGIELFCAYPGGAFFDRRGWGHLVKNTVIHFPIPARELEILGMDSYTFGGGGPGSAPKMRPSRDVLY